MNVIPFPKPHKKFLVDENWNEPLLKIAHETLDNIVDNIKKSNEQHTINNPNGDYPSIKDQTIYILDRLSDIAADLKSVQESSHQKKDDSSYNVEYLW